MKNIFTLFLLLFTYLSYAQVQKYVTSDGTSYSSRVTANKHNGDTYVAATQLSNDNHISLISYDKNGVLRFSKEFQPAINYPSGFHVVDIEYINDTVHIVSEDFTAYCFIHRFDNNGNFIDGVVLDRSASGVYEFDEIIKHNNCNYLLISDFGEIRLVNLDLNLNINWTKSITTDSAYTGKNPGFAIAPCQNGDIIITSKADNLLSVVRVAPAGSLVWAKTFIEAANHYNQPYVAKELDNNSIIITGYRDDLAIGNPSSSAILLDSNGFLVWAKGYTINGYGTLANDVYVMNNGNYMLMGNYGSLSSFLLELDQMGNQVSNFIVSGKQYINSAPNQLGINTLYISNDSLYLSYFDINNIDLCESQSVSVVSFNLEMSNDSISDYVHSYNVQTQSNPSELTFLGNLVDESYYVCGSQGDEAFLGTSNSINISYDVYPNPCSEYINIECNSPVINVAINDFNGKSIINTSTRAYHQRINVNHLASGVYILTVQTEDGIGQEKFVVE